MNEPKIPSETNDWDAIDIFLFSNGQQYSPPRKYHLRYEDLYFWETTLNLLARSQYGALNSGINLFTLNGQLINSPLELSNNGAYVAVIPPDNFVNAGYENYLIKATRSWEKRHSKRNSLADQPEKAGEITIQSGVSSAGFNKEIVNIKTPDQNITIEAVGKVKADHETRKPEPVQPSMIRTVPGSVKSTTDRRKSSAQPTPIETRTSILRKLTNTSNIMQTPSSNKRHSSLKNRDSKDPRGSVKVMTRANTSIGSVDKTPIKLPKSLDDSVVPSTNLERGANFIKISNASVPKTEIKEIKSMDKTDDKDIILISNVYRSIDDVPSNFVDAARIAYNEPKTPTRESIQLTIPEENSDKDLKPLIDEIMVRSSNVISVPYVPTHDIEITRNTNKDNPGEAAKKSRKSNDQFTAVSNKGDSVNLRLNIEVKNGECSVNPIISPIQTRSLTNVRPEKDGLNKINPEMLMQSKSLDSMPAAESHACCQKCQKVVVVNCPCEPRPSETTKVDPRPKPVENDARTYFIIVPIVTHSGKEWNKDPDVKTLSEKETQNTASLSKMNRVVVSTEYNDRSMECDGDCCILKDCCTLDRNEYVTTQRVSIANNNFVQSEYIIATQLVEQESVKIEFMPDACNNTCDGDCQNKATQTEWCSILLEVRRHEDSHYTFHLPPLQVLKMFNL